MKRFLFVFLLLISLTSSGYFIEQDILTSMTITNDEISKCYIDDMTTEVSLRKFEKVLMGKFYPKCGRMGTVQTQECEDYYVLRENIIISVRKYVVRDKERFFLDEIELKFLHDYRYCQDYIWKIENQFNPDKMDEQGKKDYYSTLKEAKSSCKLSAKRWLQVKKEGGKTSPDVVASKKESIWDKAKNFFSGKTESAPESERSVKIDSN